MQVKLPFQTAVAQLRHTLPATDTLATKTYGGSVDDVSLNSLYYYREDDLSPEAWYTSAITSIHTSEY
jgi:hypothetical protein